MENTLENKAKFFAQYWGQKCGKNQYCNLSINKSNILNITHLELKPLSQISDENAKKLGFTNSRDFLAVGNKDNRYNVDFLRSKGYALPYMDLSVEDLVEYGWVKLK